MNSDNNAQAIIEAARVPLNVHTLADGRQIALLPQNFKAEVVSKTTPLLPIPERIVANRAFHDGDSFARYIVRHKTADSLLLADVRNGKVVALLDYHGVATPAAVDHKAGWQVPFSEEFKAWSGFVGKLHDQATFIRFVEENANDIAQPDPARMLEIARDFSVDKSVKFQSSKRLQNGDRALVYVEESNVKGTVAIPEKVTFRMPIYYGEEAIEFDAWFRYRINEGALSLGFEFHRIEPVKQAAFKAAVHRVAEAAGIDPFYGDA